VARANVSGWKTLGDIILGAVFTAARRPGGLHDTIGKIWTISGITQLIVSF